MSLFALGHRSPLRGARLCHRSTRNIAVCLLNNAHQFASVLYVRGCSRWVVVMALQERAVNVLASRKDKRCAELPLPGESVVWREAMGRGAIRTSPEAHKEVFDLEEELECRGEAHIIHAQQQIKTKDQQQACPPFTANVGVWRRNGQIHWDTSVVCMSTLTIFNTSSHVAEFAGYRGQSQGAVPPSEFSIIGIVRHETKWYSRINWRL